MTIYVPATGDAVTLSFSGSAAESVEVTARGFTPKSETQEQLCASWADAGVLARKPSTKAKDAN